MIVTVTTTDRPEKRRTLAEVLGLQDTGASPWGSTFHKTLMICPHEFGLTYEVGLKPETTNDALSIGWLWHYCLQRFYEEIQKVQKLSRGAVTDPDYLWGGVKGGMSQAYEVLEPFSDEPGYKDIAEMVRVMLNQYFDMYADRDRWRIIAVEETVIYEGKFPYSTRLDLVIEDLEVGGMYLVEHKTARFITEELISNYQLDLQILGQVWLMKRCVDLKKYPLFKGVYVNISTKPTKNKTGWSIPKLVRVPVAPSDRHLAMFEQSVMEYQPLKKMYKELGYPRFLGHCAGYARGYSKCNFFELCHGRPELRVADYMKGELPYGYIRANQQVNEF